MPVLAFPALDLTPEDEAAILAEAGRGGHYACRHDVTADGRPAVTLLDRRQALRGQVTKRHGVYEVLDARGHAVLRTRRREEMLAALAR
jgi:hypothetical protein